MRVAMLISRFPPALGGAENQARSLSQALLNQGVDVEVVTHRYRPDLPRHEVIDGLSVRRFGPTGDSVAASAGFAAAALRYLVAQPRRPDILHAHMIAAPAVLGLVAARFTGARTLVKVSCSGPYGDVSTSLRTIIGGIKLRRVLSGADRLVCLSRESENEILREGAPAERIALIPNGVDTERFRPCRDEAEKSALRIKLGLPGGRLILFAGRFSAQKRLADLVRAFGEYASDVPGVHLVLVGEGESMQALQLLVRRLNILPERVIFAGRREEVNAYCRACDLFVLPSESEGLSNSLLEAMASGLVCIASRIGGNVDVMEDGHSGILFAAGSADELVGAIRNAFSPSCDTFRIRAAARQTAVARYSIAAVTRKYLDLYEQLLR
jgi:glycosyltransferase involved in cell wall biosynthesis